MMASFSCIIDRVLQELNLVLSIIKERKPIVDLFSFVQMELDVYVRMSMSPSTSGRECMWKAKVIRNLIFVILSNFINIQKKKKKKKGIIFTGADKDRFVNFD